MLRIGRIGFDIIHKGLLQQHVHTFGVESFVISQLEQFRQHITANFRRARLARDAKTIAATRNLDVEAALDLSQVFIKLTAQVGEAVVVGGLENYVPRNLDSTQNLYPEPLCRKAPVRPTGAEPVAAVKLAGQTIADEVTPRPPRSQAARAGNSAVLLL
jgi:hypothetical protein